jgi:hypothetical protein
MWWHDLDVSVPPGAEGCHLLGSVTFFMSSTRVSDLLFHLLGSVTSYVIYSGQWPFMPSTQVSDLLCHLLGTVTFYAIYSGQWPFLSSTRVSDLLCNLLGSVTFYVVYSGRWPLVHLLGSVTLFFASRDQHLYIQKSNFKFPPQFLSY